MISRDTTATVFGTSRYSPWELSEALVKLRVSHAVVLAPTKGTGRKVLRHHSGYEQPRWVQIANIPLINMQAVNLITLSHSELNTTNFPRLPQGSLHSGLREALLSSVQISPIVGAYTPMDYVNMVAKPSLLNFIQTEMYKINPYALRKETQAMILQFFNSQISVKAMVTFLQKSLKQATLVPLIHQGIPLRDAVARLQTEQLEVVAKTSGYSTFELLYLSKVRKVKDSKKPKVAKC